MIDWTKPIQTKDGRKAEFIRELNRKGFYRHTVVITNPDGEEWIEHFLSDGKFADKSTSDRDLINVPETTTKTVWLALWEDGDVSTVLQEDAKHESVVSSKRLELTFTHGVFED